MNAGAIIMIAMPLRRAHAAVSEAMAREDQHRIHEPFAGGLRDFGILTHVGRKSGKVYRTPVNVFRASNGFIIYSSHCEWVKNVLAAGGCELRTRGKKYHLSAPKVVRDPTRRRLAVPVRMILRIVGADECIEIAAH